MPLVLLRLSLPLLLPLVSLRRGQTFAGVWKLIMLDLAGTGNTGRSRAAIHRSVRRPPSSSTA